MSRLVSCFRVPGPASQYGLGEGSMESPIKGSQYTGVKVGFELSMGRSYFMVHFGDLHGNTCASFKLHLGLCFGIHGKYHLFALTVPISKEKMTVRCPTHLQSLFSKEL